MGENVLSSIVAIKINSSELVSPYLFLSNTKNKIYGTVHKNIFKMMKFAKVK